MVFHFFKTPFERPLSPKILNHFWEYTNFFEEKVEVVGIEPLYFIYFFWGGGGLFDCIVGIRKMFFEYGSIAVNRIFSAVSNLKSWFIEKNDKLCPKYTFTVTNVVCIEGN